jgi:hypothetical protein
MPAMESPGNLTSHLANITASIVLSLPTISLVPEILNVIGLSLPLGVCQDKCARLKIEARGDQGITIKTDAAMAMAEVTGDETVMDGGEIEVAAIGTDGMAQDMILTGGEAEAKIVMKKCAAVWEGKIAEAIIIAAGTIIVVLPDQILAIIEPAPIYTPVMNA